MNKPSFHTDTHSLTQNGEQGQGEVKAWEKAKKTAEAQIECAEYHINPRSNTLTVAFCMKHGLPNAGCKQRKASRFEMKYGPVHHRDLISIVTSSRY